MPVIASKSGITRSFTCSQWDAMGSTFNGWTLESRDCSGEYLTKTKSPYASYDLGAAIFTYVSRRVIKVTVDSPGAGQAIAGDILTQTFVVTPSGSDRTISIGTTSGGTDVIDNEPIRANTPFEYTTIRYFADPTFHFTVSATCLIYIVFDTLNSNET
jgi:hypothetical protein